MKKIKKINEVIRDRRKEFSLTRSDVIAKMHLAGYYLTWEGYRAFEEGFFDLRAPKIIYLCYILDLNINDFFI